MVKMMALNQPSQGLTPVLWGMIFFMTIALAQAKDVTHGEFTSSEQKVILSHGPWPMPWSGDPTNKSSGNVSAIDLGERLFFDKKMSLKANLACSSCHIPEYNWTDGLKRGVGQAEVPRNTSSMMNLRYQNWFAIDGAADSLWSQNIRPMLDSKELASTAAHVARYVRNDPDLACRYENSLDQKAQSQDEASVLVGVGKVIAAFIESLVTDLSPFDAYRNALARSDQSAADLYPKAARRGLKVFLGKGECENCHSGPLFTNGEFKNIGSARLNDGTVPADTGRFDGIHKVLGSQFNLASQYNDDTSRRSVERLTQLKVQSHHKGQFKVPSLRNVGYTGPYMHHGELSSLEQVMAFYSASDVNLLRSNTASVVGKPLLLSRAEQDDLVAFLRSLDMERAPSWRGKEYADPPCNLNTVTAPNGYVK
jgi:cytochrome c peroxidase